MKIPHISDTHFGKHGAERNFNVVKNRINALYPPQVPVLLTGDVVDDPTVVNYKAAAKALASFNRPIFAVPGNHDYHRKGIDPGFGIEPPGRKLWRKYIEPLLAVGHGQGPVVWRYNHWQFVGLDTMLGNGNDWGVDFARGQVGADQLTRLQLVLQDGPSVVIGHHRAHWRDVLHQLDDADDLIAILEPRAALYACGHQHKEDRVEGFNTVYSASHRTTQGPLRFVEYEFGGGLLLAHRFIWL